MVNIEEWMNSYTNMVLDEFQDRVVFIGLQGSYGRGEATEESDIDVVVIFDTVSAVDLVRYDTIISNLPEREKICGFVSGKEELIHWEKADLFQFYHDTRAFYGDLEFICSLIQREHVRQAVRIGACNIYHTCCHNMIHEKNPETLRALYKQSIFVLQAWLFYHTDRYIKKKADLARYVSEEEKGILQAYWAVKSMENMEMDCFLDYSDRLFQWTGRLIKEK